jgi:hypothetical protein
METGAAYDKVMEEYRQVCAQYEAATEEMVSLAEERDCKADVFRAASDKVAGLAARLSRLRAAMAPLYASRDREPPGCSDLHKV